MEADERLDGEADVLAVVGDDGGSWAGLGGAVEGGGESAGGGGGGGGGGGDAGSHAALGSASRVSTTTSGATVT